MKIITGNLNRRSTLKLFSAGAATLFTPAIVRHSRAQDMTLNVGDSGGNYLTSFQEAFYTPYEQETGIKVVPIVRRNNPAADFKAQVESNTYTWDLSSAITNDTAALLVDADLLEPLNLSETATSAVPDDMKTEFYIGNSVISFVMAYRTDKYPNGLEGFADIWALDKVPGRRSLRTLARDTVEVVLRADGVQGGKAIYEVLSSEGGWDRVYKKLDEIKHDIAVWYNQSVEATNLLQSGDVDMIPCYSNRAQVAIDAGLPVGYTWNQGFYSLEGWCIPKGSPKADMARKFIEFCLQPERQAVAAALLGNGPTIQDAYKFIDPARAKTLATYAENFKTQAALDPVFWAKEGSAANQRFQEWLVAG